jgi:hypothetical protein
MSLFTEWTPSALPDTAKSVREIRATCAIRSTEEPTRSTIKVARLGLIHS